MKEKKMQIRNSTADFLVFTKDSGSDSIEVRVQDHEVWLTQKSLGQLFDVDRSVITKHLKNVFQEGELDETTTCANFAQVADNGRTYAIHGNTAAEVIMARADHTKEHMGLTTWKNAPDGKIVKADVSIAKNYLSSDELHELNEIVTMYLDYATRQARRHIPMTMADWSSKLDAFLQFNDAEILHDKGKVTAAIAKAFAESEFEQYRVLQDELYQSDFDRLMAAAENEEG